MEPFAVGFKAVGGGDGGRQRRDSFASLTKGRWPGSIRIVSTVEADGHQLLTMHRTRWAIGPDQWSVYWRTMEAGILDLLVHARLEEEAHDVRTYARRCADSLDREVELLFVK